RAAGFRAVQCTPLIAVGDKLVGMLSTHFRAPRQFSAHDLRLIDICARQASDSINAYLLQESLRKSRTQFEKLYEGSPDAIFVVDDTGKIDRVNAAAEVLFRLSRERLVGQSIEMLLPQGFRDRHVAHRAGYMQDAKTRPMGTGLPLWARRADGSEFPVDIMLGPTEIERRRL